MESIVIHRPGGHGRLTVEQAPDPTPGPGEVLVATRAIGVNYADCIVRMGLYASAKEYVGWPITPGFEFSGEVLAVGAGGQPAAAGEYMPAVGELVVGELVVGLTRFGAYASRVVVPRTNLFPIPTGLTALEAAALPVNFLTAWYALEELAPVEEGDRVLVHSAAGGVGSMALQVARARGARVAAVVGSSHKVAAARELGAELVIDKSTEMLWPAAAQWVRADSGEGSAEQGAAAGFDVILDANGTETLRPGYGHLAPEGRLVTYGFASLFPRGAARPNPLRLAWGWLRRPRFDPLDLINANKSVMGFNLSYLFNRQAALARALGRMDELLGNGQLRPPTITPYPLGEVARAHRDLESGTTIGKLVLVPE
ncbi:MAG: zinc-binding dehydrogenase [Planctomycetota bacterium]|nr:zinc-binding dehydrogenase [Planctomycetota bacterium]